MDAPAPWQLTGRGFIAALRLPDAIRWEQGGYSTTLPRPDGRLSYLMFVDYHASNVGPYRELLFLDGRFRFADGRRHWSIGRIFVSTEDSVRNGQVNWGIPKGLADFQVEDLDGETRVRVSRDGRDLARLRYRARGPALPVTTALVPGAWRRLAQHWRGRTYYYTPQARGRAGLAGGIDLWADGERFPAIERGRCLGGVAIKRFQMTFPVAAIHAGTVNQPS